METLYFSIYSDISTRIKFCSEPNTVSAKALESSVFPTPVGPKNIKEPMGRFGSFSPTLPRLMACATACTASFCPITRVCRRFSRFFSFSLSDSLNFLAGILVQSDTMFAISVSVTWSLFSSRSFFHSSSSLSSLFFFCSCFFLIKEAASKSSFRMQSSFSISSSISCSLKRLIPFGSPLWVIRSFEEASSIKSIALSGR